MKLIIRTIAFLGVSIYMAGCASTASGPSFTDAKARQIEPNHAIIYIYREYAEPTAWGATIHIDGNEVQNINQKGFTWVYVRPGKRDVTAVWPGMASQRDAKISLSMEAGKTYYVELTGVSRADLVGGHQTSRGSVMHIDADIRSGLQQVRPEYAEQKLMECCKYQGSKSKKY